MTDGIVQDHFHMHTHWFQSLLEGAVVIGYNVQFDLDVLPHELLRVGCRGVPVDQATIDPFNRFCTKNPRTLTAAAH